MTQELTKAAQQATPAQEPGVFREYFDAHRALIAAKGASERASHAHIVGYRAPSHSTGSEPYETSVARNDQLKRADDAARGVRKEAEARFNAALSAAQQATPDHVPDVGKMVPATPEPVGEPFGWVCRYLCHADDDGEQRWTDWYFTLSSESVPPKWSRGSYAAQEAVPVFTRPAAAPAVPEGWRDAKNDPPPIGVDVLVAVEFDRPGDWRIKVGGRNPEQRTGWWVFGASWVPQVWMPLDAHRAALAAAQAKGGE